MAPEVTQIYSRTRDAARAIFLTIKGVAVRKFILRRESAGKVAAVRKRVRDDPMHIRLPHIRERLTRKIIVLMPEHPSLKISEPLEDPAGVVRQDHTLVIEILASAAEP